ncbi:MAG: xanthine dehydrogenase family protein molybdopterin-binding subunit [Burkholderiales bacterium]
MQKFGVGQSVQRFEDPRLLRGHGQFVNDTFLHNQAHAIVVRSTHAHANIKSVATAAALAAPGVLAVYTGADYAASGLGAPAPVMKRTRVDGSPMFARGHPVIAKDRVHYVGEPVAMVVAETLSQARDAAELVEVDYDPLPSVVNGAKAVKPGSPAVWDECPDNRSHMQELGDKAATEAAFAKAAFIVKRRYEVTRLHAQYMEPRGVVGDYDVRNERYVLYADVQYPHRVREMLSNRVFKLPAHRIHVITHDVGGGFGTKGWQYPEHRLMLWAAKQLGRPVKWNCERSEVILADEHARENITEIELALDAEGKFLGLRANVEANVGAYVSSDRNLLAPFGAMRALTGNYIFPAAYAQTHAVMSNVNSSAPYRGAGRPEAIYAIERIIDDAARELKLDPTELRRKNLIPSSALPMKSALGYNYDCGEFERGMDMTIKAADVAGFPARRTQAKARGKLRGLSVVNAIEMAAGAGIEEAEVRFNTGGTLTVIVGTKNQGQGHDTMYKQILVERLGVDPADVEFVDGDTDRLAYGMGTSGSRSTVMGGSAVYMAAEKLIAKGKKIAAHILETAEADIVFGEGKFTVTGTDKSVAIKDVARAAFQPAKLPKGLEPGFYETGTFNSTDFTFPNGSHACEVEIDPDTGEVKLINYVVVDDVGTVINPLTLKGQIHGGVAQGAGQILMEKIVYDEDSGQLLSASLMDYAIPRADDMCDMEIHSNPVPTKRNPLGAKGAGEAGVVGAMPAVMNAIANALADVGVKHFDMPATSERVWRAMQSAK